MYTLDSAGNLLKVGDKLTSRLCVDRTPLVEVVAIYSDGAYKIHWLDNQHNDYIIDPRRATLKMWLKV